MIVSCLLALLLSSPGAAPTPGAPWGSVATAEGPLAPSGKKKSEAEVALEAGQRALAREDWARAGAHFERAAAGSASVRREALVGLAALARQNRDDDALARVALAWADLEVGADGRQGKRVPRGMFEARNPELDLVKTGSRVAQARARAVQGLIGMASERESKGARQPELLLTAAWARRFALDLALRSPAVYRAAKGQLAPDVHAPRGAWVPVLKALQRLAEGALAQGDPGLALRAARVIHGLGAQADFKDLRGPRPGGMARWRAKGAELMARARRRMVDGSAKPWTVEELEWLASDEGEAFTRKHSDFSEPGVAVSPRGWYRVESDCGYETLLGVASTVEKHHERLAAYFGSDPFNGRNPRQGIVRIVPDPSGLEAEGAPFFWAGGFQGGDTTVLQFSVGTIPGLGRGLTHELTHRFDGALHGGIPAWLAEGRATWTGAAYAFTDDPEFAFDYCNPGTLRGVRWGGDASLANLEAILRGEPEDYRKNYSVGNALYVFLSTWFDGDARKLSGGTPVFAEQLVEFEDSGDHSSGPRGRLIDFEERFCDGEDGRPSSLEEFQVLFSGFLEGFDVEEPAPFTARYRSGFAKTETGDWVYDEPTWTWDWNRAEPVFGQNQARVAGLLLAEHGDKAAAIRALVWARSVDGFDRRISRGLELALDEGPRGRASELTARWVAAHERAGEPFEGVVTGAERPPLPVALPAVWEYHERLLEAAAELGAAGLEGTHARLLLEARRVAAWAGIREKEEPGALRPELAAASFSEELGGWRDEELTGLDKRRPEGLYGFVADGSLLLGRRERRKDSGKFDRRGGMAFLRSDRWMLAGSYSITTRVTFTTGSNQFLAVLGWTSRERNVRLRLTAQDYQYARGEKEGEAEFKSVGWGFDGLRKRDGGLPGSTRSGSRSLSRSQTSVLLELLVEGSAVSAWIDGQYAGTYHTIDGAPIEGYVGFGTSSGAVELSAPLVRRTDGEPARASGEVSDLSALDLARGIGPSFEKINNQRVLFQGDRQRSSNGTLVLWIPSHSKSEGIRKKRSGESLDSDTVRRVERVVDSLVDRMLRRDIVQPLVVLLPDRLAEAAEATGFVSRLAEAASADLPAPSVRYHSVTVEDPEDAAAGIDQGRRWLMFLDASDIIREAQPWIGAVALDNPIIDHWLTVFRDHGAPERPLPELTRDPEGDEAEEGDGDERP
ncbi:MAG: hypothetical protein P8M11_14775 [Planctomycetota bacterium]|nr:hypothetical protein [Planctomycetota bacterium]